MSDPRRPSVGSIAWTDLTVADAEGVRTFYERVAGWVARPVDMGEYADFNMMRADAETPVAGICHARGANAKLPPQWLIYITVPDLDASLAACRAGGSGDRRAAVAGRSWPLRGDPRPGRGGCRAGRTLGP